jgi:hypothetical protein
MNDVEKARELGRQAYRNGCPAVPDLDKDMVATLVGNDDVDALKLLAWMDGWYHERMGAGGRVMLRLPRSDLERVRHQERESGMKISARYPQRSQDLLTVYNTFLGFQDRKDPYHSTCWQLSITLNELMNAIDFGRLGLIKSQKCEHCGYDDADLDAVIPDIWGDRYQALCTMCAVDGHRIQAKTSLRDEE